MEKQIYQLKASEIANYIVCPKAWQLKSLAGSEKKENSHQKEVKKRREKWHQEQSLLDTLRYCAKVSFLLLLMVVIVIFLLESKRSALDRISPQLTSKFVGENFYSIKQVPLEIFLVLIILGVIIVFWDIFYRRSKKIQERSGLSEKAVVLKSKSNGQGENLEYSSRELGLSSRPHAIVQEDGEFIPTDIQPFGKKVQDRHVIKLVVHMRLMEASSGARPPYGLLVLGKSKRRVKIENTEEKQKWLDEVAQEMRDIIGGKEAIASPSFYKCKNCEVREACEHSLYTDPE